MRALLLTLVSSLIFQNFSDAAPQDSTRRFVYANVSFGLGNPYALKTSVAYLFNRRHELSLGYNYYRRRSLAIPADYEINNNPNAGSSAYPQDALSAVAVTYGYVLYPRRNGHPTRYVVRAGALMGNQSKPYGFYKFSPQSGMGPNYQYQTQEQFTAAFIFHPTVDYSPRRHFGFSGGVYVILGDDFSGGGISGGVLLGRVSNKMSPRRIHERHKG